MLRHQRGSVDGHSLVQFLNKTKANTNHNLGAQTELLYWGVPKTNFEGHPAAHWGKCLMTPDKLEGLELIGGQQVNWADHFVLDQEIPRLGLGLHVVTYRFFAGTNFARTGNDIQPAVGGSTDLAIGGPEPAVGGSQLLALTHPEPADGGSTGPAIGGPDRAGGGSTGPASGNPEPTIGGSTGPASGGPQPALGGGEPPRRPLPRVFSDPDSPPELPAAKRRRLVVDTLVTLRKRIEAAAVANHWTSPSEWNTNNVKHLIQELLQVLHGMKQDPGFDKVSTDKVGNFIGSIFLNQPSYVHLHHFADTFSAFRNEGVSFSGHYTLIESLATHPKDSLKRWWPNDADVID